MAYSLDIVKEELCYFQEGESFIIYAKIDRLEELDNFCEDNDMLVLDARERDDYIYFDVMTLGSYGIDG